MADRSEAPRPVAHIPGRKRGRIRSIQRDHSRARNLGNHGGNKAWRAHQRRRQANCWRADGMAERREVNKPRNARQRANDNRPQGIERQQRCNRCPLSFSKDTLYRGKTADAVRLIDGDGVREVRTTRMGHRISNYLADSENKNRGMPYTCEPPPIYCKKI